MQVALNYARRGLGRTAPNPSVGCVIVKNSTILAAARTADQGRPHAEKLALEMAGDRVKGADIYVTLEPCSHEGLSGSCAKALIAVTPKRVIVACTDINPAVSGAGIDMLREAGIEIIFGILEEQACALNKGFFLTHTDNRPLITLKTAISADGKVSSKAGTQQWITNALARAKAHQLRSQNDAILCGIGTVHVDDPMLTTRIDGLVHKAVRIVLDSKLSIGIGSKLVQSAYDKPLWIMHETGNAEHIEELKAKGARLFCCNPKDLGAVLKILKENGLTRILVEGGPTIHSSFIKAGLYDAIAVFQSPEHLGEGVDALQGFDINTINKSLNLALKKRIYLGDNTLTLYVRT
jgi:diaminohydroxyphosphoribosylaminopyrimidine deaminase/5-amino-6-(5-phosphoribosylamino)uracil reductase